MGETYRRVVVTFKWEPGDVLLLDNMLTAHGRYPFVGEWKIVVAMGEIFDEHALRGRNLHSSARRLHEMVTRDDPADSITQS